MEPKFTYYKLDQGGVLISRAGVPQTVNLQMMLFCLPTNEGAEEAKQGIPVHLLGALKRPSYWLQCV